ncbi:MAG: glycosyltransferase family 2 protein [Bacteroidales bacterium]|nr:glycosyltransferase family 2 protein [Bacteroidales bacterium]
MLLSIIIPVYNCSPVIIRCLESIDYPEAEILVIDDGSKDDTAQKVSKYAVHHPNVKLIRKQNSGVSSARNLGLESASGKYVMFIDADDYLVPGGINRIIDIAESSCADVVTFRIVGVSNDSPVDTESVQNFNCTIKTVVGPGQALLRYDIPDYHVVDALFRTSTINKHRIRFSQELLLREDDVFCGMLFCHTNKVVVTNLPLYRYVRSSLYSSTHNQSVDTQRRLIESSYLAMNIRRSYVSHYCPEALPYERLKYMRWVCHPQTAFRAGYSLSEYLNLLKEYKKNKCYPLDYKWIRAAGFDRPFKSWFKNIVKSFLCNHPMVAYQFLRFLHH